MKKLLILLSIQIFFFSIYAFAVDQAAIVKTEIAIEKTTATVNSLNEFAFDLYHQVGMGDENVIISPYSLSSALAMLLTGSAGSTQTELMKVLHIANVQDLKNINNELNWLNSSFIPYRFCHGWFSCKILGLREWLSGPDTNSNFAIANAIWTNKGFTYKPGFIIETKKNPFIHFKIVDFSDHPDQAREKINQWVADITFQNITNLLPPDAVTKDTLLILTNAIYFKGLWQLQFKKDDTQELPFTLASGQQVKAQMMQQTDDFFITENAVLQMLQLRYQDSPLAMAVILPKPKHTLKEIIPNLSNNSFTNLLNSAAKLKVIVSLPRFKLESTFSSLSDVLQTMDLHDTFSDRADFSNMTNEKLILSNIIQKAIIDVNEEGTVAAAATAVVMLAGIQLPVSFNANHPFIFIIYDTKTKTIFFMGQVSHP